MSGVSVTVRAEGFASVDQALARLDPLDGKSLLIGVARLMHEQTKRRIEDEKTSPDGKAWPNNRVGTSILNRSGALAGTLQYSVTSSQIELGSGLIYAAIHQYGGTITPKTAKVLAFKVDDKKVFAKKVTIPARPYLGVSTANGRDILEQVTAYLKRKLG